MTKRPIAIDARSAPERKVKSLYPEEFAPRIEGRIKQPLGDLFGLSNFGVNLLCLAPGASSALHHRHKVQDEFIYVLKGTPTLITDAGKEVLAPGMVAGFAAGGTAHHLRNDSGSECVILEVGDRMPGDSVEYPDDDIRAELDEAGRWRFTRKDGSEFG